jgi:hypothetical protein
MVTKRAPHVDGWMDEWTDGRHSSHFTSSAVSRAKNNKFLYLHYRMLTLLTFRTSEMSLLFTLNFFTEISVIQLPQIRIDDAEAESCFNVTAITCPNNLHLIIICILGT